MCYTHFIRLKINVMLRENKYKMHPNVCVNINLIIFALSIISVSRYKLQNPSMEDD